MADEGIAERLLEYNHAMTTIRAHFDGRALIPDFPVDLPMGRPLEVQVREVTKGFVDLPIEQHPLTGFPIFKMPAGARTITLEDVKRAEDDAF